MVEAQSCHAEDLHVTVRLITAPVGGVFLPVDADDSPAGPGTLAAGDDIGIVVRSGEPQPVQSPFTGLLMGLLALPRERVRAHQPVAWVTTGQVTTAERPQASTATRSS